MKESPQPATQDVRVLLLNPPGDEIYIRDYYCSKVSKTNYMYTPVDLLIISARLSEHCELSVIDAIGDRVPAATVLEQIRSIAPDTIVMLTAAVSWELDVAFLRRLREIYKGRIIASGDVLMGDPAGMLERFQELDAILTDFTTPEIVPYCLGHNGTFQDIIVRRHSDGFSNSTEVRGTAAARDSYEIPVPRHDLFPLKKYRYPFIRRRPFATVLTDFGCSFQCTFCIQSFLHFKQRSVENVMAELRYLKGRGVKDIYFSDQTFAVNRLRATKLFNAMIDEKLGFGWVAFYRVNLVDEEMLALMKRAGCHTLMFGLESANEQLLKDYKKNIKLETTRSALALCRKLGIRTVATFILGFPNESVADMEATIRWAEELPLDYVSYNMAVPRSRTELRTQAIEGHFVKDDILVMDQSGKNITMGNRYLTASQLFRLRNKAIRTFYLRPRYIIRRLAGIRTWEELRINIIDGLVLLREALRTL